MEKFLNMFISLVVAIVIVGVVLGAIVLMVLYPRGVVVLITLAIAYSLYQHLDEYDGKQRKRN